MCEAAAITETCIDIFTSNPKITVLQKFISRTRLEIDSNLKLIKRLKKLCIYCQWINVSVIFAVIKIMNRLNVCMCIANKKEFIYLTQLFTMFINENCHETTYYVFIILQIILKKTSPKEYIDY